MMAIENVEILYEMILNIVNIEIWGIMKFISSLPSHITIESIFNNGINLFLPVYSPFIG